MEVPFEYLCLLAIEQLLKYENERQIKIDTLKKYIECIKKEFIISFNIGEKACNEKGIKRNFKFESFNFNEKLIDLIDSYGDIVSLENNCLVLDESVDYDMLEGILEEFNVSSRFKTVLFNDSCRKVLGINTVLSTLMSYSLFESKLEEEYINLAFTIDKKKTLSKIKILLAFRESFLNRIKSMSDTKLECYYDESNEFVYMFQDDYNECPVDLSFWYNSMYYDSGAPDELDDILYDLYMYSLFSKNDLSSSKINREVNKVYSDSLDTSDDIDYYYNDYLEEIPDIDSDNFMDESDYEINITDDELDYLLYLTLIKKIDEYISKYGNDNDLLVQRQRLLYSLDNNEYCLYDDDNIDIMLEELKSKSQDINLSMYQIIVYFLSEEVFTREIDSNTIIKLLLISSYYDITKDEKIKMLFSKNANNKNYDLFERIVFKHEKTLSL